MNGRKVISVEADSVDGKFVYKFEDEPADGYSKD